MSAQKEFLFPNPVNNLKQVFRDIRNHLAGNSSGITRDEEIVQNIIRLLFCKIYDELNDLGKFRSCTKREGGDSRTKERISRLFDDIKDEFENKFYHGEKLGLSAEDTAYVVSKLENYSIFDSDRDVISDAFEELIGTSFRGSQGQFFTPKNIVKMIVEILQPSSGELIIDPACGSGGFLSYALRYALNNKQKNFLVVGIDKDAFLSRIADAYLSLINKDFSRIFCENSLATPENWNNNTRQQVQFNSFDIVITNPPFGAKIPVTDGKLLYQYELGREWTRSMGQWHRLPRVVEKQPPQILFIERCVQLLKKGGRMGIVLPDGIFGNPSDRYVWKYISEIASVTGVISLSQEAFQPSTHTKTSVLFLEKKKTSMPVFMAIAKNVGHNKNGKEIYKRNSVGGFILDSQGARIIDDDLPIITSRFVQHKKNNRVASNQDRFGFVLARRDIRDDIYIPEHYDPEISNILNGLEKSGRYLLNSIGMLVSEGILQIRRGNEIGSQFYGTGDIPFVRTSDIVNWEIKFDPVKSVSEDIYNQYKSSQDIRENDILLVSDGTFLIGRTALITKSDLRIIIQSHLRKIRVLDATADINPFYLLYLLNTNLVQRQIKSKTFTQATISTVGNRIEELILPVSKSKKEIDEITQKVKWVIQQREKTKKVLAELINKGAKISLSKSAER